MSSLSQRIAQALLGAALAVLGGGAWAGNAVAEPLDLEPDIMALLAKERARNTAQSRAAGNAGKLGNKEASITECGAINIGNVVGSNRIGFAPTDVNVVIVGDIINANNRCK